MSKWVRSAAYTDQGPTSRHGAPMPAGRGPSPLLIVLSPGKAVVVLRHAKRPKGLSDKEQASLDATMQALTRHNAAGLLPSSGAAWIKPDEVVPVPATAEWANRQAFDHHSIKVRIPGVPS